MTEIKTINKEENEDVVGPRGNKWKKYFIWMSVFTIALLSTVIVLAVRRPRIEYICGEDLSDDYISSGGDLNNDTSYSGSNTPDATTYTAGEKIGANAEGVTIGVGRVIKHYRDYNEQYSSCAPKSGYEYVLVEVSLTNNAASAIYLNNFDFYLGDSGGMMDYAEFYDHCYDSETTVFPFGKNIAGGGSQVSGVMLFPVRKGMADNLVLLYKKDMVKKRIGIEL